MKDERTKNGKESIIPWASDEVSKAIAEFVEMAQASNDAELASVAGGLKGIYSAYELTENPILLENIIIELLDLFKSRMNYAYHTAQGGSALPNSFLYIDRESGEIKGNCLADFEKEGMFSTASPKRKEVLFDELIEAFEDHLRKEATRKGKAVPATVKIYSNCIYNELLYKDTEGLLRGEISADSVRKAIDKALVRLKDEEAQENLKNGNKEYKRYKKNETAALNKLKKLLEGLIRAIEKDN